MNNEEVYISDVYKEAMEKLNLEITKLQEHSLKRSPHTKGYRAELEEELEALKAKKALIKLETESIQAEINEAKK